jgi:hypothetical protein
VSFHSAMTSWQQSQTASSLSRVGNRVIVTAYNAPQCGQLNVPPGPERHVWTMRVLCGVKGAFDGLGLLRDDEEKHPGRRVGLALALFPIAKGAERKAIASRKLSLRHLQALPDCAFQGW